MALDPEFAEAWGMLGVTQYFLGTLGLTRIFHGELENAKFAIQKALELDDSRGGVHSVLGLIRLHVDWDIDSARRAFEEALVISPRQPGVLDSYATFLWAVDGEIEEALSYSTRALPLVPFDYGPREGRIWMLLQMGQYERALEEVEEYHRRYLESRPSSYFEVVSSWIIATMYSYIGETDMAIDWQERGALERDPILITRLSIFPQYDLLRAEPRFQDLVYRVTGKHVLDSDPRVLQVLSKHGCVRVKLLRPFHTLKRQSNLTLRIGACPDGFIIFHWRTLSRNAMKNH